MRHLRVCGVCCCRDGCLENIDNAGELEKDLVIIPWRNGRHISSTRRDEGFVEVEEDVVTLMPTASANLNKKIKSIERSKAHFDRINVNASTGADDGVEMRVHDQSTLQENEVLGFSDEYPSKSIQSTLSASNNHYGPTPFLHSSNELNDNNNNIVLNENYLLSHLDHISMASKVAPLWFLSNYFYSMSLEWTSIASSTVLASMGSLFAFGFATCSRFGDEKVTKGKMLGVALCFMGGVATTWTDVADNDDVNTLVEDNLRYLQHSASHIPKLSNITSPSVHALLGDLAGLLSAIGYGAYTVLLRHLCPKDERRMSMQLFFGYIGVWNMIVLLPVAVWVVISSNNDANGDRASKGVYPNSSSVWKSSSSDFSQDDANRTFYDNDCTTTNSTHTLLTWSIFLFLLIKGLLDNVLSDYLWARAVILTSATVASVGVGLTIPMAFVADWIMRNYDSDVGQKNGDNVQSGEVWGALFVLLGFLFVNVNVFNEKEGSANEEEGVNFEEVSNAEILS